MGLAYLENGQRMSYEEYLKSKQWRQKKLNRLAFDNWSCGFCHKPIHDGDRYETHHVKYNRLGHENIETDIISLCPTCHQDFHNSWDKTKYWEQTPLSHWKEYSLKDTAQLCAENIENDLLLGGEYNLCSDDVICGVIDQYYKDHEITSPVFIYENDIKMFFRNKRYELLIQAEKEGTGLEEMLNERGIFPELYTGNILMCMTGIGNIRGDYDKLLDALREIGDDVAEEIMKGRADVIHVGAHDDGEWNWGVYDTPKNLVKKGYRFFKYSSFWPCTIYKYSYMVRYIRDAYDYIHFWYSHFPALAAAYENDVPVYVSKRRVVKAVVGEQTYSYYIPVRGFVISSSYLSDNASKRAICQAAFDNNHSLWYNAMDYLYRYRAEDDIVLVRDVLCKILSPIERLAMRVCFLPYVVYRECILLSRRIKNRKKGT